MVLSVPYLVWYVLLIQYDIKLVKVCSCPFMYNLYSWLLAYSINISIESSFILYVLLFELWIIAGNLLTSDNDNTNPLHWFFSVLIVVMVNLGRYSIDDINSPYDMEAPEC